MTQNNDTLLERQLAASLREREPVRALAVVPRSELAVANDSQLRFTPEQERMIRDTCANGASESEFAVLLEVAKLRRLNPLLRQVHFVKRWDSLKRRDVWSVQISIDGLRAVAQRTGLYNGQDEPEFGPVNSKGFPQWCKVRVYRKDWDRAVVGVAYWTEFVQLGKDGGPTRFWLGMPFNQLAKCAESQALRKAFPEDLGGLYTDTEMEQADSHHAAREERSERQLEREEEPRRKAITVHGTDSDEPPPADPEASAELFEGFLQQLTTIENSIPGCRDYGGVITLRSLLGGGEIQNELTRGIGAAYQDGSLSPSQRAVLSKTWQRCNRQIAKLEKTIAPPDAADSFHDCDEEE